MEENLKKAYEYFLECSKESISFEDYLKRLKFSDDYRQNNPRLSWDEMFMVIAHTVAQRSHDAQTQHGCVIVDENNHIVSTGYNGFISNINDKVVPNVRKDGAKYPYIIHSEINAILQAKKDLSNCKLYVTGYPCNECMKAIAQSGIKEVIIDSVPHQFAENYWEIHSFMVSESNIQIRHIDFDVKEVISKKIIKND